MMAGACPVGAEPGCRLSGEPCRLLGRPHRVPAPGPGRSGENQSTFQRIKYLGPILNILVCFFFFIVGCVLSVDTSPMLSNQNHKFYQEATLFVMEGNTVQTNYVGYIYIFFFNSSTLCF